MKQTREDKIRITYVLLGWFIPGFMRLAMIISMYVHYGTYIHELLNHGDMYIMFFLQTYAMIGLIFIPKSKVVWLMIVAYFVMYLPGLRSIYALEWTGLMDSLYFYINVLLKSPIWVVRFILNPTTSLKL